MLKFNYIRAVVAVSSGCCPVGDRASDPLRLVEADGIDLDIIQLRLVSIKNKEYDDSFEKEKRKDLPESGLAPGSLPPPFRSTRHACVSIGNALTITLLRLF